MPQVVPFFAGALGVGASGVGIGAALGWSAGAKFAATALGGIAVNLMTSVALSALSMALQGKPKTQIAGMRTDQTLGGGVNPEGFILGWFATNGALVAPYMSHGKAGKTPNAYLNYVIELGGISGQPMEGLALNGEAVEILSDDPHADYGQRIGGRYLDRAWVRYYDGSQTAADPMLLAKYPVPHVRPWTADMVGAGICYAVLTFQYDREVFQGWPSVRFVMGGIPVYDPRQDSTQPGGSGAQRWGQPSTYRPSKNNAVLIYNIMRGIRLPGGAIWGGDIPAADLPLAVWMAAMDACDVQVSDGAGGLEPQYRAGLEVMVEDEPWSVVEELLSGCLGALAESGGVWTIRVGAPGLPVMHITDDDLLADAPDDFKPFPTLDQIYNGIEATYPDPDSNWESRDAEPIHNLAWEAQDGARQLTASIAFNAVPYPVQVARMMTAVILDHRRMRSHVIVLPPEASQLQALDVITWTSATNFYTAKLMEVKQVERDLLTGRVTVTLREVDPEDYDPPAGLTRPEPPDLRPLLPQVQAVPGWSVQPWRIKDDQGVDRRPGVLLSWDPDGADDARGIRFAIRLGGETTIGTETAVHDHRTGVAEIELLAATVYEIRARFVVDRVTMWADWISVLTPDVRIAAVDLAAELVQEIDKAVADSAAALLAAQAVQVEVDQQTAAAIAAAEAARDAAWESALDAGLIKTQVEGLRDTTEAYKIATDASKIAAELARTQAQTAATSADGSASAAAGSASTATTKAGEAGNSAVAAAASVVQATAAKDGAEDAADASAESATTAAASATAAGLSAAASQSDRLLAQTARSGSESARDQSVTARDTATGAASTATTQAGLATTARNQASGFADTALGHSQSAASQASAAGSSATAAETNRIAAQTARTGAETAESNAVSATNTAEGAASTATTQAGLAVTAAYDANQLAASLLPSDFNQDWKYWASSWGGVPGVKSRNFTRWALDTVVGTRVAVVTAPQDSAATLATQGNISAAVGRRYRIEVSARHVGAFAGGSQSALRAYLYKIDAGYASAGAFSSGLLVFTTANSWETLVYNSPAYDGAETMLNGFIQNVVANMGVAGPRIEVRSIKVLDVTETIAAEVAATASATSASTATTKASEAGVSAAAANQSKLDAQAASSQSGIARDESVSAKNDAAGSAATALTSMQMAARITGRGAGVLKDQFLGEDAGISLYQDAAPIYSPNSQFPTGRDVRFNVAADVNAGISFSTTGGAAAGWQGTMTAEAYVVEVDFTLHTGSIIGAGVRLEFPHATTSTSVNMLLQNMIPHSSLEFGKMYSATGVIKKGAYAGAQSSARAYFMASWLGLTAATRPARQITIHRMHIRPATFEELGLGAVEATISQKYATTVDMTGPGGAISQSITSYNASVSGGLSATVVSSAAAVANLNGFLAATATLTAEVTGGKIAGIRATVYNGAGGGSSGSLLELIGDNVIAPGTLSVSRLIVTDMSNLVPDGELLDAKAWTLGSTWAISAAANDAGGSPGNIIAYAGGGAYTTGAWFPVAAGEEYLAKYKVQRRGNAGNASTWMQLEWGGQNKNSLGFSPNVAVNAINGNMFSASGTLIPPVGAMWARVRFAYSNGASDALGAHFYNPTVRRKAGADVVVDGAILARHLTTSEAVITNSVQIGTANVDTLNIAGNAVTVPVYAEGVNVETQNNDTWRNLVSVTVVTPTIVPTLLHYSMMFSGYTPIHYRIVQGSRVIMLHAADGVFNNPSTDDVMSGMAFDATKPAGSATYTLQVRWGGSGVIARGKLLALGVKR